MKQSSTSAAGTPQYETFARFYDAFTAESDYEAWTSHILELARSAGLRGDTLLDVACGTGKSFAPFLTRGFEVTACDLSPAMLAEAKRRAPGVPLVTADMRDLPVLGRFDIVTCFDDALNYLLGERELVQALRSIRANLAPTGLALFDLNTLRAYRTTFAQERITAVDGLIFAWRGESSTSLREGSITAAQIDVFAPLEEGLYERVSTWHVQRHFPPAQVLAGLAESGLECAGVYGVLESGELVPDADESSQLKVLYLARPVKGGDTS